VINRSQDNISAIKLQSLDEDVSPYNPFAEEGMQLVFAIKESVEVGRVAIDP